VTPNATVALFWFSVCFSRLNCPCRCSPCSFFLRSLPKNVRPFLSPRFCSMESRRRIGDSWVLSSNFPPRPPLDVLCPVCLICAHQKVGLPPPSFCCFTNPSSPRGTCCCCFCSSNTPLPPRYCCLVVSSDAKTFGRCFPMHFVSDNPQNVVSFDEEFHITPLPLPILVVVDRSNEISQNPPVPPQLVLMELTTHLAASTRNPRVLRSLPPHRPPPKFERV